MRGYNRLSFYVNLIFLSILITILYKSYFNLNLFALSMVLFLYVMKKIYEEIFSIKII
ncbi:MAG: hypothetical protein QXW35_01720 [Candidatus Aenigmatarchaeota archaeon]